MKARPILQVEDDPNDILFLQVAFEQAQITQPIEVVRDGQGAIEYLANCRRRTLLEWPCRFLDGKRLL